MNIIPYQNNYKNAVLELIDLNTPAFFAPFERSELDEYLDKFIELYYVVESYGEIVGAAGINFENGDHDATMSWDIVHPDYKGKGIGSLLVEYRLNIVQKHYPLVNKLVSRTSQLAESFYKKHGFNTIKVVKDHWAAGIDLHLMERRL